MATKEVSIAIGKSSKDLRVKHFKLIQDGEFSDDATMNDMIQCIHLYSGMKPSDIRLFTMNEIIKMYVAIMKQFSDFKTNDSPPKTIKLGDIEFVLVDPEKVGYGWHEDFRQCNINEPERLACMFYIPKGKVYGKEDANGNLETSIKERMPYISEHLPLSVFIECCSFFLQRFEKSTRLSMVSEKSKRLAMKMLRVRNQ